MSSTESTVYMFGFRERTRKVAELPAALRWLAGERVEMTPDVENGIRAEFARTEHYRGAMLAAMQKSQRAMLTKAAEAVPALESPCASITEAYWQGFTCGLYSAYSDAAHEVAEVSAAAAIEALHK